MKLIVEHKNTQYTLTFDKDGILDTITNNKTNEMLYSTNPVAKKIFANLQSVISGNHRDFKVIRKIYK